MKAHEPLVDPAEYLPHLSRYLEKQCSLLAWALDQPQLSNAEFQAFSDELLLVHGLRQDLLGMLVAVSLSGYEVGQEEPLQRSELRAD